jgi:hypothetical protein
MTLDSVVLTVLLHSVMPFVMSCRRSVCGQTPRTGEDESAHEGARDDVLHRVDRAQPALAST